MKIISGILILITTFMGIKHGWDGLHAHDHPEQLEMMTRLGLSRGILLPMSILSIVLGIAVLIPATFFVANIVQAVLLVLIMAFALRGGDIKTALIEIPFLLIPMVLIYLGHPFKSPLQVK